MTSGQLDNVTFGILLVGPIKVSRYGSFHEQSALLDVEQYSGVGKPFEHSIDLRHQRVSVPHVVGAEGGGQLFSAKPVLVAVNVGVEQAGYDADGSLAIVQLVLEVRRQLAHLCVVVETSS